MATIKKPKWNTDETIRAATGFHEEAVRHRSELEPRLREGEIDALAADIQQLRNTAAGAVSSRAERNSATVEQNNAMRRAASCISAIRTAIRRAHPDDKALQRDFGVGHPVFPSSLGSVASNLRTVLNAGAKHPDQVAAAGILPADLSAGQAGLEALTSTDDAQERRMLFAKEATLARTAAQRRVEAVIDHILGAASVAFQDRPEILQRFASLLPASRRKKGRPAVTADTTSSQPAPVHEPT